MSTDFVEVGSGHTETGTAGIPDGWRVLDGLYIACCFVDGRRLCGRPFHPSSPCHYTLQAPTCRKCDERNDGLWHLPFAGRRDRNREPIYELAESGVNHAGE